MYAMYLGSSPAPVRADMDHQAIHRLSIGEGDAPRAASLAILTSDLVARVRDGLGLAPKRVEACSCPA
jgi:hypothetical protein